jgi:pyruvate/2-oxoglutarate dehydrogenase complex dihydrolipoamide dehydrogenase (E3) component
MAERFDLVIIGGGEAGQAAAYRARDLGASVAIVDRELWVAPAPTGRACRPRRSSTPRRSITSAATTPGRRRRTSATG